MTTRDRQLMDGTLAMACETASDSHAPVVAPRHACTCDATLDYASCTLPDDTDAPDTLAQGLAYSADADDTERIFGGTPAFVAAAADALLVLEAVRIADNDDTADAVTLPPVLRDLALSLARINVEALAFNRNASRLDVDTARELVDALA